MRELTRNVVTPVWIGLIVLSALSLWLGRDSGLGAGEQHLATVIVMVVAFVKVRFVGIYFIELRQAPLLMKVIFQVWCAGVCSILLAIYLIG